MTTAFRVFSAFNVNIELTSPECTFRQATFAGKWGIIMALPLVMAAIILLLQAGSAFFVRFVRGQSRKAAGAALAPLASVLLALMAFIYLYIATNVFTVLTCRTSDPPEYDASGAEIR